MTTLAEIKDYISKQSEPKQKELNELHKLVLSIQPKCKLWFLDGTNEKGKLVTNPNIGYGSWIMNLAGGKTREFYQVGLSPNTGGISVYIMGLKDKKQLVNKYSKTIGKATVTGYCIKFKALKDIDLDVLKAAIKDGFGN